MSEIRSNKSTPPHDHKLQQNKNHDKNSDEGTYFPSNKTSQVSKVNTQANIAQNTSTAVKEEKVGVNYAIDIEPSCIEKSVKDFDFDQYTFKFPNKFESTWVYWNRIPVGDSSYGLCGGMVFGAKLYYENGVSTPQFTEPPSSQNCPELFEWLKDIQAKSVPLFAAYNYFSRMFNYDYHNVKHTSEAIKTIIDKINNDKPCVVGIIRAQATIKNPMTWGNVICNHQVLAYAYKKEGDKVTFSIYDPRSPGNKDMYISCNVNGSNITSYSEILDPIYSFFIADIEIPTTIPSIEERE
ncbi:MAG: hypothetical protein ACK5Z5_02460 [Neisseriaceae bacterium]